MKAFLPFIIWPSGIGLLRAKSGPGIICED